MGWMPWTRDKAESFYVYNVKMRRAAPSVDHAGR